MDLYTEGHHEGSTHEVGSESEILGCKGKGTEERRQKKHSQTTSQPVKWLDQQVALDNSTSAIVTLAQKKLHERRRAGTRWADFITERLDEQNFDSCDVAPQWFGKYQLDDYLEVHMDDLHGTRPKSALEQIRANLSQMIW